MGGIIMKKSLLFLFLLLVAVLGIGCVSAADNTTVCDNANHMAMAPHAFPNENLDINSTVIRETPDVPSNSPDNNTTSGPQLDIKGPKIGDHPIIIVYY